MANYFNGAILNSIFHQIKKSQVFTTNIFKFQIVKESFVSYRKKISGSS